MHIINNKTNIKFFWDIFYYLMYFETRFEDKLYHEGHLLYCIKDNNHNYKDNDVEKEIIKYITRNNKFSEWYKVIEKEGLFLPNALL